MRRGTAVRRRSSLPVRAVVTGAFTGPAPSWQGARASARSGGGGVAASIMTIPQAVLTLAGLAITLAALVVGLIWKLDAKNTEANRDAHKKIGESIKAVDDRAERRDNRIQAAVSSIARDVSFLAGRQAERDQSRS